MAGRVRKLNELEVTTLERRGTAVVEADEAVVCYDGCHDVPCDYGRIGARQTDPKTSYNRDNGNDSAQ